MSFGTATNGTVASNTSVLSGAQFILVVLMRYHGKRFVFRGMIWPLRGRRKYSFTLSPTAGDMGGAGTGRVHPV
jgi:hypothetical protein